MTWSWLLILFKPIWIHIWLTIRFLNKFPEMKFSIRIRKCSLKSPKTRLKPDFFSLDHWGRTVLQYSSFIRPEKYPVQWNFHPAKLQVFAFLLLTSGSNIRTMGSLKRIINKIKNFSNLKYLKSYFIKFFFQNNLPAKNRFFRYWLL